jgi:hypothetical protein
VAGNGSYTVSVSGLVEDGAGNDLAVPVTSSSVSVDNTAPTLGALTPDDSGPVVSGDTVNFPANFSEPVSGFAAGDVTINHTGTSGGSVAVTGGPQNYSIAVSGVNDTGSYTVSVTGVTDPAGNAMVGSVTSSAVAVDNGTSVPDWSVLED